MTCPGCQFEASEGAAFCVACGEDFTPVRKRRAPQEKRNSGIPLMAWPALLAVACMAIVALVREPEPQPVAEAASFSEPVKAPAVAPARKPAAPRKTRALLPAPAPATDPMEAATPEQWRAESYANRITFTANYVSARANVGSTVNLRNAAIWMETCISTSAAQAASVGPAASACFADLARRR